MSVAENAALVVGKIDESGSGGSMSLVAIDGWGGAGKSTLADAVAELLRHATIIRMDDFYRPMTEHLRRALGAREGYERYFDWQRLERDVLSPLRSGVPARYRRYDWGSLKLEEWHEVSSKGTVIVEGVYSARPELKSYYYLIVLVETSADESLRRQRLRAADPDDWIARWRRAETWYKDTVRPERYADIIVKWGMTNSIGSTAGLVSWSSTDRCQAC